MDQKFYFLSQVLDIDIFSMRIGIELKKQTNKKIAKKFKKKKNKNGNSVGEGDGGGG